MMMSKELLLALIERRADPVAMEARIQSAIAVARQQSSALVQLLPPELLHLMEAFIASGLTLGYQCALIDVSDDVNGVQS